jgi:hypothetical protein
MAALPPPLRNPPQDTTSTWSHSTARTLCRSLTLSLSLSLHAAGSLSHTRNSRRAPYLGDNASFSLPASQSFLTSPGQTPAFPQLLAPSQNPALLRVLSSSNNNKTTARPKVRGQAKLSIPRNITHARTHKWARPHTKQDRAGKKTKKRAKKSPKKTCDEFKFELHSALKTPGNRERQEVFDKPSLQQQH